MAGVPINRTNINLPPEVSAEILAKTQEASAVMQLARQIQLPGRGVSIPVITGDPQAAWVGETDKKPVSDPSLSTMIMEPYKLAVIVPFSNEFRRDAAALYDELVRRLPLALAQKFDATVFGAGAKPGDNFDTFAEIDGGDITTDPYLGVVQAESMIAEAGGIMNGIVLSPQGKSSFLLAVDGNKRPLFIDSVAEGSVPVILGARTLISKGAYYNKENVFSVGIAGDWTQAMYGTVEGVKIDYSSDATLDLADGTKINLFQQNMFAVRAEIEIGFRADTSVFARLFTEK